MKTFTWVGLVLYVVQEANERKYLALLKRRKYLKKQGRKTAADWNLQLMTKQHSVGKTTDEGEEGPEFHNNNIWNLVYQNKEFHNSKGIGT